MANLRAMGRVDIHCHLLPGVDDGAASLEEALGMAAVASADGTNALVVTPHVRGDFLTDVASIPDRLRELREAVATAGIRLRLLQAAELGHDMVGRLRQNELETIAIGPPDGRWILLETPFAGIDDGFHAAAGELRDRGFGVVLAHPERTRAPLAATRRALRRELAAGSLLQVNAHSLCGGYGEAEQAAGIDLVRDGLAAVIASDGHPGWRLPQLTPALVVARRAGLAPVIGASLAGARPQRLVTCGMRRVASAVAA